MARKEYICLFDTMKNSLYSLRSLTLRSFTIQGSQPSPQLHPRSFKLPTLRRRLLGLYRIFILSVFSFLIRLVLWVIYPFIALVLCVLIPSILLV